ncbi:MAG: fasciclin domain-containing protein [Acidimicrobiia bacterium]
MRNRTILVALVAAFAMLVAACSSSADDTTTTTEEPMESTSVLDLAVDAGQFSTLIAAVEAAGLVETLEGEGPFTVLAPTDEAFEEAFEALGISAADLLADTETLTAILTYHVLPQAADSQLVATLDGQSVPTVNGQSVNISVVDGQIMVDAATVVSADLEADNGIVHVINGVLLPPDIAEALGAAAPEETTTTTMAETTTTTEAPEPTIAEIVAELAAGDPAEFTILLAALETAGLVEALNNPDDELTVFAPTDAAFGDALEALDITAEELLASEDLPAILTYHVVAGVFDAATVIEAAPIPELPTLNADATLNVQVIDGAVVINDGADPLGGATVIQADVFASNGVIHVIDTVLLP